MKQVHIIGIDLAKNGFQLHGAGPDGSVAFRKKLTRGGRCWAFWRRSLGVRLRWRHAGARTTGAARSANSAMR